MSRVRVLVCGEPMRGDDAAAQHVADALPAWARALADVITVGQLSPEDMLDEAGQPVIVVDAAAGPAPGTILDLPLASLARQPAVASRSSHVLPIGAVVAMATAMRGEVAGRFIGLAGLQFGLGDAMSAPVVAALPAATARLARRISVLAGHTRDSPLVPNGPQSDDLRPYESPPEET